MTAAEQDDSRSSLGRSAALMTAGTAVSRVLGVVRAAVLIAAIGMNVGPANAFAVANMLPNVLYMLIAGGVLNAVLVPQVVRAYRQPDGQVYVDRLLTVAGLLLLGLTTVLTVGAPLIVRIYVTGEATELIPLATTFAVWCIPQVFFYGMYTLLGQVLNARGSFGPYMWAPVVNNVVAIAGLIAFIALYGQYESGGSAGEFAAWDSGRIGLLAGSATLGVVLQALVLVVPLRRIGFRYRPRRGWRGVGLATAGRVAGWTFAALAVGQLGILVVQRIASAAAEASGFAPDVPGNAAYGNAFLIFMLPHSLVTVSLVTALFTRLSDHAAADDTAAVRRDFSYGLRTVGVFTVIATAVLCVLALPLIRLALPSTTPPEAGSLARVVVAMSAGLVALGAWSLVQRVYYAYEDARSLFWIQAPMAAVVAVGSWVGSLVLPHAWWLAGAGAAIALQYVVGAVAGGIAVRRRLGGSGRRVVDRHLRAGAAALAAAAIGWPLSRLFGDLSRAAFPTALVVCVLTGVVMLAVYVWLLRVLGVTELRDLVAPLAARLGRSMGAPTTAGRQRGPGAAGGGVLDGVEIGQGTLLAGRYRLRDPETTDLPGVECWSAEDQILDRPVRAYVLRGGRVTEAQDAARRAALVTDPRLLRVLDVGAHEGVPYTVTEPPVGRDLAELTADGPIPADQARAVVGEAAVALEVARRRGVHHLALRPSAVRITSEGKVVVSGLGFDGEIMGHGLGDARSTTRADTVGLVALLYLALTGRWPVPQGADAGHVPTAPVVEGSPVPPAELVPAVPNDLDTLCAVTLGPHDDGPHSPAELVRELEPWGEVDAAALTGLGAQADDAPLPPLVPPAGPAPQELRRTSVRGSFDEVAGTPPGTPPPAARPPVIPPRVSPAAPRTTGVTATASQAGAGTPSSAPPVVPPARASHPRPARSAPRPTPTRDDDFAAIISTPAAAGRARFDPTPWVLLLVLAAVVVGVFMAWRSLTEPLPPIGGGDGVPDAVDITSPPPSPEDEQETAEEQPSAPEQPADPAAPPPVIASGVQLDPEGDGDEHPEAVGRAYDGDPGSFWFTRTYANPAYGMKSGVGYAITLAAPATISTVTLDVNGTGGNVEIRATDPGTPNQGDVLASGPMGPGATYTLTAPTETSTIVLWFTELPVTPEGKNRVELREIGLS